MKYRQRTYYTEAQKSEMWDRWQNGESMSDIARSFDRYHTSLENILRGNGGIRPRPRSRSKLALSLAERETISRGLAGQLSIRSIAEQLGRSPLKFNDLIESALEDRGLFDDQYIRTYDPNIEQLTYRVQLAYRMDAMCCPTGKVYLFSFDLVDGELSVRKIEEAIW